MFCAELGGGRGGRTPGVLFGHITMRILLKERRDCSPLLFGKNNTQTNRRAFLNAAMIYK